MAAKRKRPKAGGDRESGRDAPAAAARRDEQYDLLAAALIGAALGASAAFLLGQPARLVRRRARGAGAVGRIVDRVRPDELRGQVRGLVAAARTTINEAVESEVRDLRKSLRRQRRKLGI